MAVRRRSTTTARPQAASRAGRSAPGRPSPRGRKPVVEPGRDGGEHRDTLASYVARKALKWTRQREVILDTFLSTGEHLTCEQVHARVVRGDPSVGLATVYRTLRLFVEAGIASERRFQDGVTRFEVHQPHHDHLICVRCGQIIEFESDAIERLQDEVARTHGFRLMSHRHELYGSCEACGGE